jgi:DNA repair protein RadA/Sms
MGKNAGERGFHACSTCGYSSPKWFGRCPDCGSWDVRAHGPDGQEATTAAALNGSHPLPGSIATGVDEVDRVLGGGLVEGGVVLLAGEPGIGKSTLVLQVLAGAAGAGRKTLLVTGEESIEQVSGRVSRLQLQDRGVVAIAAVSVTAAIAASENERPDVLVVDSIQTLHDPSVEQAPGSVIQVRECAARLVRHAKETGTSLVIVGHVTKDGNVAGPKTLEHVVDTLLFLEGERTGSMRFLRVMKNRFGSCEETGVFSMSQRGLEAVADPSSMLLADRCEGMAGSAIFPALEGTRPLLAEMQALVARSNSQPARRVATGVDAKRLALILAVLSARTDLSFWDQDVYVAAAGGVAVKEPAADLAAAAALYSTISDVVLEKGLVVMGELGLGGEVRRVPGIERRLSEAARMGFTSALTPRGVERQPAGMRIIEVAHIRDAFAQLSSLTTPREAVAAAW